MVVEDTVVDMVVEDTVIDMVVEDMVMEEEDMVDVVMENTTRNVPARDINVASNTVLKSESLLKH